MSRPDGERIHMLKLPLAALGWLGRRGTGAVAASILVGMALPSWSAYARP